MRKPIAPSKVIIICFSLHLSDSLIKVSIGASDRTAMAPPLMGKLNRMSMPDTSKPVPCASIKRICRSSTSSYCASESKTGTCLV